MVGIVGTNIVHLICLLIRVLYLDPSFDLIWLLTKVLYLDPSFDLIWLLIRVLYLDPSFHPRAISR